MRVLERYLVLQRSDYPRRATAVALMLVGMVVLALGPNRRA